MCLLSGGIDSPVAAYMIGKRGVEIEAVHFFSYPYTSQLAKDKVVELARLVTKYTGRMTVNVVSFTEIQEAIRDNCPEEFFTLIMRRFMMEISMRIAKHDGCGALITGENLGQVASQTMEAMAVTGAVVDIPIFMPLVGFDKEEIVSIARKIGRSPDEVFKTLVTEDPKHEHFVFVVPAAGELDLKKAAKVSGKKSIDLIPSKQLLNLTGYIHGGCSPVGMKKSFPTFIDESAILYDTICVSGGRVGLNVAIAPEQLAGLVEAEFADLCKG